MDKDIILETKELKTYFYKKKFMSKDKRVIKAVDGISLKIARGETLGLVGESGCGKSTFGKTVLNLVPATSGEVLFNGKRIDDLSERDMFTYRKKMQLVFQNPYSSLNPRMTIREAIESPLRTYKVSKVDRKQMVESICESAGIDSTLLERFPHEFSGGQRQRIVIARALVLDPEFVVCDEPVSALDVSVRAQILNLMVDLKQKNDLTYLFISHDLSVVKHISDRVAVMYLGEIVEMADKKEFFESAEHPYSKALLSAIPVPDVNTKKERIRLTGDVPNVYNLPSGCRFHTRCVYANDRCRNEAPELKDVGCGHLCACHNV